MTRRPVLSRLLAGAVLATLGSGAGHAATRDADLIGTFRQLCLGSHPSVAAIEQSAEAMQLGAGQSARQPSGSGGTTNARTWAGTLASGPYQLIGSDTVDARGHLVSCGLSASDVDGATFQQDLVAALQLGQPSGSTAIPNSTMVLTTWKGTSDPNVILQLLQSTSPATPGIMISYIGRAQ